jgi:hypothetical protein
MVAQSIQFIGPPAHHPNPLLPEFGSMDIGAPNFIRLLMCKLPSMASACHLLLSFNRTSQTLGQLSVERGGAD